jgi:dipeptidyl-peptidase-4
MMKLSPLFIALSFPGLLLSQGRIDWAPDGSGLREIQNNTIVNIKLPDRMVDTLINASLLIPKGESKPLQVRSFEYSTDNQKVLIYTNTRRVWRLDTKGDYWLLDLATKNLKQLGATFPPATLMFAKISPDSKKVAYVQGHNIYVEDINSGVITPLTTDGDSRLINGTFDWVYEEEFGCRDGFRWSPDAGSIAYWQIDARQIRNFLMINNTDSTYSFNVPVEYPKVGEAPSPYKIGVVPVSGGKTRWMNIPGDPRQTYLPRMEWAGNSRELIVQQLNRKQNTSSLFYLQVASGAAAPFYQDKDDAWIDIEGPEGWDWLEGGKSFLWQSEKDGWRHVYVVSRDGKKEICVTPGNYDVISIARIDEENNRLYFMASPDNATQSYLYQTTLDGKGIASRISPIHQTGFHSYDISPKGTFARHNFSNAKTRPTIEWLQISDHSPLDPSKSIDAQIEKARTDLDITFLQITTASGVTLDAWFTKPKNFNPNLKYPVVFNVYGEPAGSTVRDAFGTGRNNLYKGDMSADGYIYASVDNRGTPSPKGRAWRKAIYRNIGRINILDMAEGAQTLFATFPFMDTSRVAVHGWSGGGSSTLNLLFQYPTIFKTGISVAAVADQLSYDNIYQERYMGIPQENKEDFVLGSPITHAKNLVGNLLYIHGTGDDNVHYQNAEKLVNELIKHNRQFQFMPYPNRAHGIREGEGTTEHLRTLFTNYLRKFCPPGGKP